MSIPGSLTPLFNSGGGAGYQVSRSIRLNPSDSAFLSRTPASAGNRKTWTWSGWVKRSGLGAGHLFVGYVAGNDNQILEFRFSSDKLHVAVWTTQLRVTTQVFRDIGAWAHVVLAVDTTQAVANDRVKLYWNGVQITQFDTTNNPAQNADLGVNQAGLHTIGREWTSTSTLNGYLADIHFIDGQALTPASFAETNATTGQWVPKAYTGSYGTNGFKLSFSNNASTTTISQDSSGNNNHWTANNISVTAGAGNDSLVDTPTSYGTDTGAGGEVRGNYCTWNPIAKLPKPATLSNGNLDYSASGTSLQVIGTIGVSSGKWYWEVENPGGYWGVGMAQDGGSADPGNNVYTKFWGVDWSTNKVSPPDVRQAYGYSGAVCGVAFDADNGTLTFYGDGVNKGVAFTGLTSGPYFPAAATYNGTDSVNFGQRPFAYTAPSGFKALCDTNLPAPTIAKPSTVMDVKLYTGNTPSTQTVSGLGFSPDLVWLKVRNAGDFYQLYDSVRGATKYLHPNVTNAEATDANALTAFNSDGFSVGSTGGVNSGSMVAWTWDAGSSTVTNTSGSISSQVRANASAGFSVVTYTGNTGTNTIGHGLGVAPALILNKRRDSSENWYVYHSALGSGNYLILNATNASAALSWGGAPTSSVFYNSTSSFMTNGGTYVAYCFAPVAGYSSFGSYVGNGTSGDGVFVYTGFRVRWLLIKQSSAAGEQWFLLDSARSPYNVAQEYLCPSASFGETSAYGIVDFLSNGFKLRATGSISSFNGSGATYIYAAFAESSFQFSRAR